jgi:hypothetical protein
MRLAILDSGHRFGTKVLFAIIRAVSRQPTPEVVELVMYRPDFFGTNVKTFTPKRCVDAPSGRSVIAN